MAIVKQISVGPMRNFSYLLVDQESREAMIVDSGWETGPLVESAQREKARVIYAVATHGHFDHVQTLPELAKQLGAKVVAYADSEIGPDVRVRDGDTLKLGSTGVKVLHTPGHTEDSICLYDGRDLFTGDALFIGNCGRTDLPGGSPEKLYHSLHDLILRLPPETIIYPGHDYGDVTHRTLVEERKTNPCLAARTLDAFLAVN